MGRRNKSRKSSKAERDAPRDARPHEPPLSSRAEVLQQAEALIARAMTNVMRIGYGDELTWPGRVARADGFQVRIAEMAIDLATERLSSTCDYIAKEIASGLGVSREQPRTKYRVLPRTSRDEPEPPEWYMPPGEHEAPRPSSFARRDRAVQPGVGNEDARRDPVSVDDEAPKLQPREGLH
jgi:hypothetical protein